MPFCPPALPRVVGPPCPAPPRPQLQAGALKGNKIDPRKLFKGVGTVALCGSAPAFGFFFGVYEPFKYLIEDRFRCDPTVAVLGASVAGAVPASIIGVPTDVIKKRLVLGLAETPMGAARQVIAERGGVRGLFIGWEANLLKDVPFAAFKLSLYEGLMRFYLYMAPRPNSTVQAWESSAIGVASGMVSYGKGWRACAHPLAPVKGEGKGRGGRRTRGGESMPPAMRMNDLLPGSDPLG